MIPNAVPPINMVLALDEDEGLGDHSATGIPWNAPGDLKHFRFVTQNTICVMGKTTYYNLLNIHNNPNYLLSDRHCVVLTSDPRFERKMCPKDNVSFVDDRSGYALSLLEFMTNNGIYDSTEWNYTMDHWSWRHHKAITIMGGASVYRYFMDSNVRFNNIWVTRIEGKYNCPIRLEGFDAWLKSSLAQVVSEVKTTNQVGANYTIELWTHI